MKEITTVTSNGAKEGTIVLAVREGNELWIDGMKKRNPDPQIMSLLKESDKALIEFKDGQWRLVSDGAVSAPRGR